MTRVDSSNAHWAWKQHGCPRVILWRLDDTHELWLYPVAAIGFWQACVITLDGSADGRQEACAVIACAQDREEVARRAAAAAIAHYNANEAMTRECSCKR